MFCPFCGEWAPNQALRCPNCQYQFSDAEALTISIDNSDQAIIPESLPEAMPPQQLKTSSVQRSQRRMLLGIALLSIGMLTFALLNTNILDFHPLIAGAAILKSTPPTATASTMATATPKGLPTLSSPFPANLVVNSGFESGNLNSWICESSDTIVTKPTYTGSFSLQVAPTSTSNGQCSQIVSVLPNHSYTLKAYAYGSYVYLGVDGYGANWISDTSFMPLSYTFTTDASTTSISIYIHGWYSQGTAYIDDISLQ
jgi:Carbohydrate binding domain